MRASVSLNSYVFTYDAVLRAGAREVGDAQTLAFNRHDIASRPPVIRESVWFDGLRTYLGSASAAPAKEPVGAPFQTHIRRFAAGAINLQPLANSS